MDTYTKYLLTAAVIPGVILLLYVYRQDRIEKEPAGLLLRLFIAGALSILSAIVLEIIGEMVLDGMYFSSELTYNFALYFIVVAGSEELGKYFMLKSNSWNHPEFNFRFDAIVYSVCVGLGFAVFENIKYAFEYGMQVTLMRALTAVPAHAVFAIFMGYHYGEAKLAEVRGNPSGKRYHLLLSYLVPVLLHGLYDFSATLNYSYSTLVFLILVILMDRSAIRRVRNSSRQDFGFYSYHSRF